MDLQNASGWARIRGYFDCCQAGWLLSHSEYEAWTLLILGYGSCFARAQWGEGTLFSTQTLLQHLRQSQRFATWGLLKRQWDFGRPFLIHIPIRWMISSSNFFLVLTSWRNKCPMVLAAVYSKGRGSIPTPFPATGMTTLIGQHFEPFWKERAAVTSCLWRTLRITKLFSEWFSECCETTAVFPVVKWTGVVSARLRLLRDVMVSKLRLESCLSDDRVNDAWWPLRMAQRWSTVFLIQGLLYQSVLSEKQLTQTYITFQAVFDWVHSFFQIHCGSRLVITHSQRLVPKFALAAEKTTERIVIAEVSSMELPLNWMVSGIGNHEVG